jgi:hypothetical protein
VLEISQTTTTPQTASRQPNVPFYPESSINKPDKPTPFTEPPMPMEPDFVFKPMPAKPTHVSKPTMQIKPNHIIKPKPIKQPKPESGENEKEPCWDYIGK